MNTRIETKHLFSENTSPYIKRLVLMKRSGIELSERDKRKKQLCKKNNCTLIYVYPEDDYDSIVEEISKKL